MEAALEQLLRDSPGEVGPDGGEEEVPTLDPAPRSRGAVRVFPGGLKWWIWNSKHRDTENKNAESVGKS